MLSVKEKAAITFFCQICFVSELHNISERNRSALCFDPLKKKFLDKRDGGVSIFSDEFFSVSQCRKFFSRNPPLYHKIFGIEYCEG